MTDGEPGRTEGTAAALPDLQEWETAEQERLELELLQIRFEGMLVTSALVALGAAALTVGSVLALTGRWSFGGQPDLAGAGLVLGLYGLVFGVPQGLMALRGLRKCKALVGRLTALLDRAAREAGRLGLPEHGRTHTAAGSAP